MTDSFFMQCPTALLVINPYQDIIIKANQTALALFNLPQAQLKQPTVSQLFNKCLDKLLVFSEQALSQGSAWCDDLFIEVDEIPLYLEVTAKAFEQQLILSCQDSSYTFKHRYQAEAENHYRLGLFHWSKNETVFEEIERHNQLLLSAVGDGIYGVDTKGCTTFVNSAAEQILGWKKHEIIGQKIHDIIHHTHHNGHPYPAHECPIYAAFHDGTVHIIEDEVFWSKSGSPIAVEYTSTPVTDNGVLIGAVVIFRDITERKRTQQKLVNALQEVDKLKSRLEMENAYLLEEINADFNHHQIIGQSAAVQRMVHQIELVGPTDANVLIIGESGTGKELVARAIHEVSSRQGRPLIRVNCAAIPAELFESEFFGHVKGAFSGAVSDRLGRFELADGATIFLDEVGEIPLQLQGKLLRVLQEQQFERVGESKTRHVDVRVIAATNQDLKKLVKQNKFREDLYFRLNVFPVSTPALRERKEDLPLLVQHFIYKVCMRFNQPQPKVSMAQMQYLQQYTWPGNIRELENIIERQVILAKSNKLSFDFLADEHNPTTTESDIKQIENSEIISASMQKTLEKENIRKALVATDGKIYGSGGAAELLDLKPTTLASKLKKYNIDAWQYKPNKR
ncbi:sigma 54-interacting transcriptional regulator [Catenovulum sediminis]|uniref:sigma 54-interacting transcriptional regulator n=1 Tax=Catenovulum sediminis TaxID=1740262 RepID=UPI00117D4398